MTDFRIPLNSRVRLRDGISPNMYEDLGLPGNEGWIRKHKMDEDGFGSVFIQWDTDHWAYNGTKDRWSWEDHFEIVEAPMSIDREQAIQELTASFAAGLTEILNATPAEESEEAEVLTPSTEDVEDQPSFEEVRLAAAEATDGAEAFIVIAIREEEFEGDPVVFPAIYGASKNTQAATLLQLQMGQLVYKYQEKMLSAEIASLGKED